MVPGGNVLSARLDGQVTWNFRLSYEGPASEDGHVAVVDTTCNDGSVWDGFGIDRDTFVDITYNDHPVSDGCGVEGGEVVVYNSSGKLCPGCESFCTIHVVLISGRIDVSSYQSLFGRCQWIFLVALGASLQIKAPNKIHSRHLISHPPKPF